jgi:hypothetical protein
MRDIAARACADIETDGGYDGDREIDGAVKCAALIRRLPLPAPAQQGEPREASAMRDREDWRDALIDTLDLKRWLTEEVDDISLDRSRGRGEAHGEHEPGVWVVWNAEYPEDGSLALKDLLPDPVMLAAVPQVDLIADAVDACFGPGAYARATASLAPKKDGG